MLRVEVRLIWKNNRWENLKVFSIAFTLPMNKYLPYDILKRLFTFLIKPYRLLFCL